MSLKDRLVLPSLFPQKGSLVSQMAVRDISDKIKIDADESKKIKFKSERGRLTWDAKKAKEREIDFTEVELNFLKDQVQRLDKEQAITQDLLDLSLKIKNYVEEKK